MGDEPTGARPWDDETPGAQSTSGQSTSADGSFEAWDDDGPRDESEPSPRRDPFCDAFETPGRWDPLCDDVETPGRWDPFWDAFEPYDRLDDPQPEEGDFWVEEDDEGETT